MFDIPQDKDFMISKLGYAVYNPSIEMFMIYRKYYSPGNSYALINWGDLTAADVIDEKDIKNLFTNYKISLSLEAETYGRDLALYRLDEIMDWYLIPIVETLLFPAQPKSLTYRGRTYSVTTDWFNSIKVREAIEDQN